MKIDFVARVDIGKKETNDDFVLVSGQILGRDSYSGTDVELPAVAAVCDGCGGYAGGGIAAKTVLQTLASEMPEDLADVDYLVQVLDSCQEKVMKKKTEMPQYSKMCTTIAGCVFSDTDIIFFHSGDSRVYRCDRWGIARMTRDHSVVQNMVDLGQITQEEAKVSPRRNVINRCIGMDGTAPEIYISHVPINAEEKYLICSDGLWESVTDAEIKEILDGNMTLQQMADMLIAKALNQGADDNVSVCICAGQGTAVIEEDKPFILD